MQIKGLKLRGVGRFHDEFSLSFDQGLNVITGDNESGKSTLVKSIETSLFGFKPVKDWKYANWNSQDTLIEAEVTHKQDHLTVVRKYGSKIRGSVHSGHMAENIGNQALEGHLIDLELFKAMFSISVDELAGIDKKSWKELTASLTDAYNHSAFKSAAEAQEIVDQKASEIFRESGRGNYELKQLQGSQDELENQIKQLEIERAYAVRSEEELKDIQKLIERIDVQIKERDHQIKEYEANHHRLHRRREYRQKWKDYQDILSLGLPERNILERWIIESERQGHLLSERERLVFERQRLRDQESEESEIWASKRTPLSKLSILFMLVFIIGTFASVYLFQSNNWTMQEQLITGGLAAGFILVFIMSVVKRGSKRKNLLREHDKRMYTLTQASSLCEMQLHHFEDELERLEHILSEVDRMKDATGINDIKNMLDWVLRAEYLKSSLDDLLSLEEDPQAFLSSIEDSRFNDAPEEKALKALLDERDQLISEKAEQEKKLIHTTNLSVREIDFRLSSLKEQRDSGNRKIMETSFKRDRLLLVSRIVAEAEKLYRKSQKPDFLIRASRYMNMLTGGRYEEILMSEGGGFVLKSGEDLIPISETISRGTKEQMYLSLKLAMSFRLDPLGLYPILMDEIAINFDHGRRQGLYAVMKELSEQRQILYFTCHKWQADEIQTSIAGKIIELKHTDTR